MDSHSLWLAFLDTGAPEMYLLYSKLKRQEESNVSDNPGVGSSGNQLQ